MSESSNQNVQATEPPVEHHEGRLLLTGEGNQPEEN